MALLPQILMTFWRSIVHFVQWVSRFSFAEKQQYITLAHKRIDLQHTYKYQKTEDAWAQLLLDLLREDDEHAKGLSLQHRSMSQPDIADIAHLVNRPAWREELLGLLAPERGKKFLMSTWNRWDWEKLRAKLVSHKTAWASLQSGGFL